MADEPGIAIDATELKTLQDLVRNSGDGGKYGITDAGFVPKPYVQLLREGFAAARVVIGDDVDLAPGSVVRKLIELNALEMARTYATLAGVVDDMTVPTARGHALSRLGEELGVPRPSMRAIGTVQLTLKTNAPSVVIGRGARMMTGKGHNVFTTTAVTLTQAAKSAAVEVQAFLPGLTGNLDPSVDGQKITLWNGAGANDPDDKLLALRQAAAGANKTFEDTVGIAHTAALSGGDARWPDEPYRDLLLRMPRSVWTAESIQAAVSLVPGVRGVAVQDQFGGLDIDRAIFGNFNFIERLFAAERDITSPYAFSILVAPEDSAIWGGTGGLREQVLDAIEDLRPIGLFPRVERASSLRVYLRATIVLQGIPLPSGSREAVNASPAALAIKQRLRQRVAGYIGRLGFGEPVRAAKVGWQLLSDPSVVDVQDLELGQDSGSLSSNGPQWLGVGENLVPAARSIPVLMDDDRYITVT